MIRTTIRKALCLVFIPLIFLVLMPITWIFTKDESVLDETTEFAMRLWREEIWVISIKRDSIPQRSDTLLLWRGNKKVEFTRFYRKDGSMFDWHLFIHLFGGINIRWMPGLGLDYVRKYPERHYWVGPRFQ